MQKIESMNKIIIKKYGSWNCIPHATEIPICLSKTKNTANIKNEDTIPKAVYMKLSLKFVVWLFKTDNSFIDKTGKTHGIKFKIKPPSIEIKSI